MPSGKTLRTHLHLPEVEREPAEEQETDKRSRARGTGLPEPIIRLELPAVGLGNALEVLREGVQGDVVDDDREGEGTTVGRMMSLRKCE